jgi:hypothetical protein
MLIDVLARATPSVAQIYKWTDASGTIHFSDSPPATTRGNSRVEVLPETKHVPSRPIRPPEPEAEPPEPAVAPPDQEPRDDTGSDYATEPEESTGSDEIIVDETARDPAVWYRANSPSNRPGQPMRQPIRPGRRR